jgi:predicted ATP-dependent endonuclease of OLD family
MKIKTFRIQNFKCFDDTRDISLAPGMNLVSGANNAGKTALLQALELQFQSAPNRSVLSLPHKSALPPNRPSEVEFVLDVTGGGGCCR